MDVKKYKIVADNAYRLDLICELLYGVYNDQVARLLINANPLVDIMNLEAGTILKVPPKSLLKGR